MNNYSNGQSGSLSRPAPDSPVADIKCPFFIIGCGRSGTTVLGKSLSYHPAITYLNEPRHLWAMCFPETDIWTEKEAGRHGQLAFSREDAHPEKCMRLRQLFSGEVTKTGRPVLVEKLPINNFRLSFIYEIFPDARFIHIVRNGLEVASSIARLVQYGWFGANDKKWKLLADYASSQHGLSGLPEQCSNAYERGLLEWRLSTEAIYSFVKDIPDDIYYEITYDGFTDNPVDTIKHALSFIGLDDNKSVTEYVVNNVRRRSTRVSLENISEKEEFIAGNLLRYVCDRNPHPV